MTIEKENLLHWAKQTLHQQGYQLQDTSPAMVQDAAWAQVYRFSTNKGFIYCKHVPENLGMECQIIQTLANKFHAPVPYILAYDSTQHCFLMQDAGMPLHVYFQQNGFQQDLLIQALQQYTDLQIATTPSVQPLLNLGLPDWRIEKLPDLFNALIAQTELLKRDGLTDAELKRLPQTNATLRAYCKRLSQLNIPATFGHCDFHDKNILIHPTTKDITLIDLGEVAITHPLFSILNCIHMASERFSLSPEICDVLKVATFQHWIDHTSLENLTEAFGIIQNLWSIHALLAEYRLMQSVGHHAVNGRLTEKLRHWLGVVIEND